jgi:hypothetical protein
MKSRKVTVNGEYVGTVILNDAEVIEWHDFDVITLDYMKQSTIDPVENPLGYFNTLKLLATGIVGVGPVVEGV